MQKEGTGKMLRLLHTPIEWLGCGIYTYVVADVTTVTISDQAKFSHMQLVLF